VSDYLYCRFAGYPRTGGAAQDVHVAPGHGSRPPAAQSRSELSLATRSGPRTMEATRGNGYAPVRGMPAMMMMICTVAVVGATEAVMSDETCEAESELLAQAASPAVQAEQLAVDHPVTDLTLSACEYLPDGELRSAVYYI